MAERCLIKSDWEDYFNDLSKKLKNIDEKVEIEIVAPSVFEGEEGKGLKLLGLSYDPKDNIFSVFCENIDHIIHNPQEICLEEEDGAIKQVRINDDSGAEHLIKFSTPLK